MKANDIAEAFHTNCPKRNWKARIGSISRAGELVEQVHFADRTGLISLTYDLQTGEYRRFSVTFEKALASWGDYVSAIAKGVHTIMAALQSGGLPFVAPNSLEDIGIITRYLGAGGQVTAELAPAPVGSELL